MGRKGYSKSRRFSAFFKVCLPRRDQRTSSDRNFTTCSLSPLSIISCWFSLRKLANHKGQQNVFGRHFEEDDAKHGKINEDCMHGGSSSSTAVESGHEREVSFNMGVGFGIIYVMAASKCELNKMVGICNEMETLVQDFKMQFQNQQKDTDSAGPSSESNMPNISTSTTTTITKVDQDDTFSCDQNSNNNINTTTGNTKLDELEAELEVELEHLQVQLDTQVMLDCQCTEILIEDSAPEESISTLSFGQVYEAADHDNNAMMENDNGVCPLELERRLHELLEMRQEERIKALESALQCAMEKLHENQRELSWWKDTARLVFHKIPLHSSSLRVDHTFN